MAEQQAVSSLEDIWIHQQDLNRRAGFDTAGLGQSLVDALKAGELAEDSPLRVRLGKAIKNYIDAMSSECHELQGCLAWKHWYREAKQGRQYELQDIQNARVEAIDMLFFWVSICQILGLSPRDVYRLYAAKLEINHKRQDEKRSQADHADHESENRSVL